jgi:hypothetical protein
MQLKVHVSSSKPFGTNRLNFLRNVVSVGVIKLWLIAVIIIIIITAIEFSLCGSSSYSSADKTNKNKYT